ncbi:putative galacturonosyltransferase 11 [Ananas comosus]|uniref:Hexosyltransferase n=1 Tax=Ananas comosus TaxID=4615 RepID=A0A199VRM2_ANACO|nr:putative galacturonosyltransferase 11 [Ananas comosus]
MRRRAAELRRPQRRRRSLLVSWLLGIFAFAGAVLFALHHYHHQERIEEAKKDKSLAIEEPPNESFNFTHELLSSTSFARQLVDQVTLAKAYIIIAKEHNNLQLAWELSSQVRNHQKLLSQAAVSGKPITLEEARPLVTRLSRLIYKAQDCHYDISTTITTLKNHALALEERAKAAVVQSTEFGRLASEEASLPKSLHCLNMKLTEEWFQNPTIRRHKNEYRKSPRLVDNNLYHFCIFSDNIIATSVVVNSTVSSADHPQQLVFHVVTNKINYWAMTSWFLLNDYNGCTVEVRSIEEFSWFNAKFVSSLNYLLFYIPQIHPNLEKVVLLDDDVVVQKDLTPLFSIELHGNVIGAVETCLESFRRFYKYLNFSNPLISSKFDPQSCGWAFGMNILDLIAWRKANVTAKYHYWEDQNADHMIWKKGALPPGLLAFYGVMEPLDRRWHVLGLGFDVDIDEKLIETAAVVHYSGNMKPWLKLAITRYKHLWDQYVDFTHPLHYHKPRY